MLTAEKKMLYHAQFFVKNALRRKLHSAPAYDAVLAPRLNARLLTRKELITFACPRMHPVAYMEQK